MRSISSTTALGTSSVAGRYALKEADCSMDFGKAIVPIYVSMAFEVFGKKLSMNS